MTASDMRCQECQSYSHTELSCQVFKNGRVKFRVDCERCGCFSHYLPRGASERAVEKLLTSLNVQLPAASGRGRKLKPKPAKS